jgi:hypothetical protein
MFRMRRCSRDYLLQKISKRVKILIRKFIKGGRKIEKDIPMDITSPFLYFFLLCPYLQPSDYDAGEGYKAGDERIWLDRVQGDEDREIQCGNPRCPA